MGLDEPPLESPLLSVTDGGGDGDDVDFEKAAHRKVGIPNVALNMSNAIIGAGIVGLPNALREAGLGLGVGLLLAMAALTWFSVGCLIESACALRVRSYETLAREALGRPGEVLVVLGQFIFDYGAALSYLIILGDTSESVVGFATGNADGFPGLRQLCIGCGAALMLPLCLLRDISKLEACAAFSIVSVSVLSVCVITKLALRANPQRDAPPFMGDGGAFSVVSAIGIFSFSFVCQDSVFLFFNTLRDATPRRFRKVSGLALGASSVFTVVVAVSGFLSFRAATRPNILDNYGDADLAAVVMRCFYTLTMVCVYPTCVFVCRQAGHALLKALYPAWDADADVAKVGKRRHLAYSLALWGSTVGVALVTKKLGIVMSLTGNVAGSLLGFILPGLITLSPTVRRATNRGAASKRVLPAILILFGAFSGVLGVVSTFYHPAPKKAS